MNIRKLMASPKAFRKALHIEAAGDFPPFSSVAEAWQTRDFLRLDSAWQGAVDGIVAPCQCHAWLERPRGHSKTTDLASMVSWALFAARRHLRGYAAAADADQAGLLRDAIASLASHNSWLGEVFDVQRSKIVNRHTGSELTILTSDSLSSYGLTPDFIVADELCHWRSRDLWDSLFSAAAKRPGCLLVVISNAGHRATWQWKLREAVRHDPGWYFSRLDGPQASWITAEVLDEQRRLLPDIAYRRLWLNEWGSTSGDLLCEADLQAALEQWTPANDAPEVFVAGLDLGLRHDASALVVVAKDKAARLRVHSIDTWRAPPNGKLELGIVEQHIDRVHRQLRLHHVAADPWQASYLLDRLKKLGVPCHERPQTGKQLNEQATELIRLLQARQLSIPNDGGLLRDLRAATITEKSYGLRIDSPRDQHGHGDTLSALAIAVAEAKRLRAGARHYFLPAEMQNALPAKVAAATQRMHEALAAGAEKHHVYVPFLDQTAAECFRRDES